MRRSRSAPAATIARPAGTHRAHALRAGPGGMTRARLRHAGAERHRYYPRSGKVSFRGVGVIGRLEQLDYWDGED